MLKYLLVLTASFLIGFDSFAISTISIPSLKKLDPQITYVKVHNKQHLQFEIFPIASSKNATWNDPIIPETFVLILPHGQVYSHNGYIIYQNKLIEEMIWPWSKFKKKPQLLDTKSLGPVQKITGKVAVLTQEGHTNYYHWMTEILPKLALLQEKNIQYDWLYLPKLNLPFMKDSLKRLDIDFTKIIEADENTYIEADELIIPSFVSRSCYTPHWVVEFLNVNLLKPTTNAASDATKIFISRSKASVRRILNEDEIFKALEPYGFKRYWLEDLSLDQQMALFQHAEIIIAAHGAGLTNLIFSRPGTQVFEIFQQREDDTYWYLSQVLGLKHKCIKTVEFSKANDTADAEIPLQLIQKEIIKNIQ